MRQSIDDRFWSKVTKTNTCWLWTAGCRKGYGQFWDGKRIVPAHRWAYESLVGSIAEGLTLDHVRDRGCTSKACVNPAHLEPVTQRQNTLRWADGRTVCRHGHDLTDLANVYSGKQRRCRPCVLAEKRKAGRWKRTSSLT